MKKTAIMIRVVLKKNPGFREEGRGYPLTQGL